MANVTAIPFTLVMCAGVNKYGYSLFLFWKSSSCKLPTKPVNNVNTVTVGTIRASKAIPFAFEKMIALSNFFSWKNCKHGMCSFKNCTTIISTRNPQLTLIIRSSGVIS